MKKYEDYIIEIKDRQDLKLQPKPIEEAELLSEIILQIKDLNNKYRDESINFFIYNVTPGTTSAASVKAKFLKEIILCETNLKEISIDFAFELLSHMKGGASIKVLLDIALAKDSEKAQKAAKVLKSQVFLYEADIKRLETAFNMGNLIAKEIIESYLNAEFFTKLPEIDEEVKVVTFVAGVGDISTDLLSPGGDAHSRSDRELHGKCMFEHNVTQQNELLNIKQQHPDKTVMLIAEKGTMGVGSSRMSGVNNVALWIGRKASPYVPFINIAPVVAGTNGISPIFLTTVGVTGGIGLDLKNWVKKIDEEINIVTYVAGEGDISTDLLSPGGDAHTRSDRELHGKCMFEHNIIQQNELLALQKKHPNKTIMLIAEKGTMGVGSSRMSGINNVSLWIGKKASPYIPFINIAPVIAGTNGISPIFLTTVGVTGGIGLDLKNWVKKKDVNGKTVINDDGEPILEEVYSIKTGTVLTINTKKKILYNSDKELIDISASFTPQKMEFMRAGGSYAIVFGKKTTNICCKNFKH
jgi:aconitase B